MNDSEHKSMKYRFWAFYASGIALAGALPYSFYRYKTLPRNPILRRAAWTNIFFVPFVPFMLLGLSGDNILKYYDKMGDKYLSTLSDDDISNFDSYIKNGGMIRK